VNCRKDAFQLKMCEIRLSVMLNLTLVGAADFGNFRKDAFQLTIFEIRLSTTGTNSSVHTSFKE
jgi:hypothetical protein